MKSKFNYLLLPLLILSVGCIKTYHDPGTDPNNWGYPLGTFSGNFVRIHKNMKTYKYDTTRAVLQLTLSTNTGYMITGDTTVHAGSYGSFSEDFVNMDFADATYSIVHKSPKIHLHGFYTYTYDGSSYMEIKSQPQTDTLRDTYYLTKEKK